MANQSTLQTLLATVRIYWDEHARKRDEFGKFRGGYAAKALHDELHEQALEMRLATELAIMERHRPVPGLRERCRVGAVRPQWWPATKTEGNRQDLLIASLGSVNTASFERSWYKIRREYEKPLKDSTIWNDDPALLFSPLRNVVLCRTASIAFDGWVYYFVFGSRERDWENILVRSKLSLYGQGEASYRCLVPEPGRIAGG